MLMSSAIKPLITSCNHPVFAIFRDISYVIRHDRERINAGACGIESEESLCCAKCSPKTAPMINRGAATSSTMNMTAMPDTNNSGVIRTRQSFRLA